MRILHISDLHFGAHNEELTKNLQTRASSLKPDVVIATGDLANQPRPRQLKKARDFLQEISKVDSVHDHQTEHRRRLVVVPGNHDVLFFGNFPFWANLPVVGEARLVGHPYRRIFRAHCTEVYFPEEGVWIYGFDSAMGSRLAANGRLNKREFVRFRDMFDKYLREYGDDFRRAVKILVVHHHPLPVKEDSRHQRWLMLEGDAGRLLGTALRKEIDLILHGHEHVQAKSTFSSTLGAGSHSVHVVSVGATLKKMPLAEGNWFNLIDVANKGEPNAGDITVRSYRTVDDYSFKEEPDESHVITNAMQFERWKREAGFHIGRVVSFSELNDEGDCKRLIYCGDFTVGSQDRLTREKYTIHLPPTTGYFDYRSLDCQLHSGPRGLMGLRIQPDLPHDQACKATLRFDRPLQAGEELSFCYSWWAINSFAMDQHQLEMQHGSGLDREWTHYPVADPIDELRVLVDFPSSFAMCALPTIRVSEVRHGVDVKDWPREPQIEAQLTSDRALFYVPGVNRAVLMVKQPKRGFSYGVEWRVPEAPEIHGFQAATIKRFTRRLRDLDEHENTRVLVPLLRAVDQRFREKVLANWDGELYVDFLLFETSRRKLAFVCSVRVTANLAPEVHMVHQEYDFGEGIAGKALKLNGYRLYTRPIRRMLRESPHSYRPVRGRAESEVSLAMPLQCPTDVGNVYAVIQIESTADNCPLTELLSSRLSDEQIHAQKASLSKFQVALNSMCFEYFIDKFDGRERSHAQPS